MHLYHGGKPSVPAASHRTSSKISIFSKSLSNNIELLASSATQVCVPGNSPTQRFFSFQVLIRVIMGLFINPRLQYYFRITQLAVAIAFLVVISYAGVHRGWWKNINAALAVGGEGASHDDGVLCRCAHI